jgi:D-alanyl-D-alanine carboxypeptidase (penicillin-binding protein 5/6)
MICLLLFSLPVAGDPPASPPAPPELTAKSVAVMDATTGEFLFEKDADARRSPASLTKMLTAIIVLERVGTHGRVVVGRKPVRVGESSIGVELGEEIELDDLLSAVLIKSANDATAAAADYVAGTSGKFAELMNQRARELGAAGTHFTNPHGLFEADHYTTAHDLALIARRGMQIPDFRRYVGTVSCTIPGPPGGPDRVLHNRNKLMETYPGATGIKTGYVRQSGRCVAAAARREQSEFIAIILDSERLWEDAAAALDWAFANYETVEVVRQQRTSRYVPVTGGTRRQVLAYAAETIAVTVRRGSGNAIAVTYRTPPLMAPVRRGEDVGVVVVRAPGGATLTARLLAARSISGAAHVARATGTLAIVVCGALLLLLGGMLYGATAKGARRRRRRVAQAVRGADLRWPGHGQRASGHEAGNED